MYSDDRDAVLVDVTGLVMVDFETKENASPGVMQLIMAAKMAMAAIDRRAMIEMWLGLRL